MKTLKDIISKEEEFDASPDDIDLVEPIDELESVSRRLMCIITAFELLSGQGASFSGSDGNLAN